MRRACIINNRVTFSSLNEMLISFALYLILPTNIKTIQKLKAQFNAAKQKTKAILSPSENVVRRCSVAILKFLGKFPVKYPLQIVLSTTYSFTLL